MSGQPGKLGSSGESSSLCSVDQLGRFFIDLNKCGKGEILFFRLHIPYLGSSVVKYPVILRSNVDKYKYMHTRGAKEKAMGRCATGYYTSIPGAENVNYRPYGIMTSIYRSLSRVSPGNS